MEPKKKRRENDEKTFEISRIPSEERGFEKLFEVNRKDNT